MEREVWKSGNMLYPLPAVMVSCGNREERPNIITLAWTGTVCSNPAMVSISVRPERYSYQLIRESGEFVINLTTEKLTRAMDFCGVRSGRDVDKFQAAGLHMLEAAKVRAPLIEESPVNIECRVTQVLELGSHHMFLARVEAVDVDASLLDDTGRLDLNRAGLIVYSHGEYYSLGKMLGTFGYSVKKRQKTTKEGSGQKTMKEGSGQKTMKEGSGQKSMKKGSGQKTMKEGSGQKTMKEGSGQIIMKKTPGRKPRKQPEG